MNVKTTGLMLASSHYQAPAKGWSWRKMELDDTGRYCGSFIRRRSRSKAELLLLDIYYWKPPKAFTCICVCRTLKKGWPGSVWLQSWPMQVTGVQTWGWSHSYADLLLLSKPVPCMYHSACGGLGKGKAWRDNKIKYELCNPINWNGQFQEISTLLHT